MCVFFKAEIKLLKILNVMLRSLDLIQEAIGGVLVKVLSFCFGLVW